MVLWSAGARARRRLIVGAALVGLLGVFDAVTGTTSARWHDREPISSAALRSGTVLLLADGVPAATLLSVTVTPSLGPTSTGYRAVTVANGGDVAVDYRLLPTEAASTPVDLATVGLSFAMSAVGAVAQCGTVTGSPVALTTGTGTGIAGRAFASPRLLPAGGSEVLCLAFTAPSVKTPATFRAGTANLTLTFLGQSR